MSMKRKNNYYLLTFVFSLAFVAFGFTSSVTQVRLLPNRTFNEGESVDYRVHYGFITAGEATMKVHNGLAKINGKPCFRIEVLGKTTGAFDKFLRIRDTWGSLVDTSNFFPLQSYRLIEEGNYRLKEVYDYDFANKKALIQHNQEKREVKLPGIVQDMVSGYYYFRLLDYNGMKTGEIINVTGIFEDKVHYMKVRYNGKEKLKTKFGRINAIVLSPIMPDNKLFDGENAIQFYISDDLNRVPLKISAELMVGAVELDIKEHRNLKYPLKFD